MQQIAQFSRGGVHGAKFAGEALLGLWGKIGGAIIETATAEHPVFRYYLCKKCHDANGDASAAEAVAGIVGSIGLIAAGTAGFNGAPKFGTALFVVTAVFLAYSYWRRASHRKFAIKLRLADDGRVVVVAGATAQALRAWPVRQLAGQQELSAAARSVVDKAKIIKPSGQLELVEPVTCPHCSRECLRVRRIRGGFVCPHCARTFAHTA